MMKIDALWTEVKDGKEVVMVSARWRRDPREDPRKLPAMVSGIQGKRSNAAKPKRK
jgi:hypothetical protein